MTASFSLGDWPHHERNVVDRHGKQARPIERGRNSEYVKGHREKSLAVTATGRGQAACARPHHVMRMFKRTTAVQHASRTVQRTAPPSRQHGCRPPSPPCFDLPPVHPPRRLRPCWLVTPVIRRQLHRQLLQHLLEPRLISPGSPHEPGSSQFLRVIDLGNIAGLHAHNHELHANCPRCGRWSTLPLAEWVNQGKGLLRLPINVRCRECGEPGRLQVRPPTPTRGPGGWMEPH